MGSLPSSSQLGSYSSPGVSGEVLEKIAWIDEGLMFARITFFPNTKPNQSYPYIILPNLYRNMIFLVERQNYIPSNPGRPAPKRLPPSDGHLLV